MSPPFVIAIPAKGRLQENAEAFFARSGLELVKPRGARNYRGAIADLPGIEVAYLSAAEIVQLLAQGAVHFGVTGEDLLREMIPDIDARIVFVEALGFGHANVVVAVPQAWIDVHSMADLDDVTTAFRETARLVLDRIAAQARARAYREVRTRFVRCDEALLAEAKKRYGVESPFGGPTSSGMLTLHCPPAQVHALASFLRQRGAENVAVGDLGYVFARENPLYARLQAGLGG